MERNEHELRWNKYAIRALMLCSMGLIFNANQHKHVVSEVHR